jgi:hypothetical protein
MLEHNHYERAAAAWLRSAGLAFVPVHERQRASLGSLDGGPEDYATVKSPDFLLLGRGGISCVVDVKGRRHPSGSASSPPGRPSAGSIPGPWHLERSPRLKTGGTWECWVTLDDLDGLARWSRRLGPGWDGLFLFAYWLDDAIHVPAGPDLFWHEGRRYLFRCAKLQEFRQAMRIRSRSWGTVDLPARAARMVVKPLGQVPGFEQVQQGFPQVASNGVGW